MNAPAAGLSNPPPRRYEALAFIIERIALAGIGPSHPEIGHALKVGEARAKQLVNQLVKEGLIEKTHGAQRNLRVRDLDLSRSILEDVLRKLGWAVVLPTGEMEAPPYPHRQLPVVPRFEHLPDFD